MTACLFFEILERALKLCSATLTKELKLITGNEILLEWTLLYSMISTMMTTTTTTDDDEYQTKTNMISAIIDLLTYWLAVSIACNLFWTHLDYLYVFW